MDKQKVGSILTSLRKERGETTTELAAAIGSSQSAISMYETGARIPRDDVKLKLSRHFGVSVDEIFFAEKTHEMQH